MDYSVIAPDEAFVTYKFTGDFDDYALLTIGTRSPATTAANVASEMRGRITPFMARFPSSRRLVQTRVVYNDGFGLAEGLDTTVVVGGDSATTYTPPNNAFLVHKNSNLIGRKYHGRWYIPSVAEGAVDPAGTVSAADIAIWNPILATYLAGCVTDGNTPIIFHSDGSLANTITSLTIDTKVATQRRRLRS